MKIRVVIENSRGKEVGSMSLEVWRELLIKYFLEYNSIERAVEVLIKDIKMSMSTK